MLGLRTTFSLREGGGNAVSVYGHTYLKLALIPPFPLCHRCCTWDITQPFRLNFAQRMDQTFRLALLSRAGEPGRNCKAEPLVSQGTGLRGVQGGGATAGSVCPH